MSNRQKILNYIDIQQDIHKDFWPKYVREIRGAMSFDDAWRAHMRAELEIAKRFGHMPDPARMCTIAERLRVHMMAYFDYRCAYCNQRFPHEVWKHGTNMHDSDYRLLYHMDHVNPKSAGGAGNRKNLIPACPKCNLRKNATPFDVWLPPEPGER